jgi:hypothetical protein
LDSLALKYFTDVYVAVRIYRDAMRGYELPRLVAALTTPSGQYVTIAIDNRQTVPQLRNVGLTIGANDDVRGL